MEYSKLSIVIYLNSKNPENNEKSTADENNISNRPKRGKKSLNHQFETRSSIYDSERPKRSQQAKDLKKRPCNSCALSKNNNKLEITDFEIYS